MQPEALSSLSVRNHTFRVSINVEKLDVVAPLVTDPPCANYTPLLNTDICQPSLYMLITFEPIMQFVNLLDFLTYSLGVNYNKVSVSHLQGSRPGSVVRISLR